MASTLLLTASTYPQSGFELLSDSMQRRVKSWSANRTTDRNSLRYCINDRLSLESENAEYRNREAEMNAKAVELNSQVRFLTADNGAKDITIMNLTSEINDMAGMKMWAGIGKGFVVAVGIAGIVTLVAVLK